MEHWKDWLFYAALALLAAALGAYAVGAAASPEDSVRADKPCKVFGPADPASPAPVVTICAWGVEDLREFEILYHPPGAVLAPSKSI